VTEEFLHGFGMGICADYTSASKPQAKGYLAGTAPDRPATPPAM